MIVSIFAKTTIGEQESNRLRQCNDKEKEDNDDRQSFLKEDEDDLLIRSIGIGIGKGRQVLSSRRRKHRDG